MKEKQTFEDDFKRLQKIVEELAGGRLTLGESLKKYEEGIRLATAAGQQRLAEEMKAGLQSYPRGRVTN